MPTIFNIIQMHASQALTETLREDEDKRAKEHAAKRAAQCADVSQAIRDCLTQAEYDLWWESASETHYYDAACDKLLELYQSPTSPCWTSYTPSQMEIARRAIYNGRHIGRACPKCGLALRVNEKQFKTTNPDAPHFERRITCSGYFVSGCDYKEKWKDEYFEILNRPIVVNVEIDF